MYAINGTLTDAAKREAAGRLSLPDLDEAKYIIARAYVETGFAKYLNPIWLRRFGFTAYLHDVPPDSERACRRQCGWACKPYGKNAQEIYTEMDSAWDKISMLPAPDSTAIEQILNESVDQDE